MYSLHDISITGIAVREVLECEVESLIGEHSTLTLLAYTDGEEVLYELPNCQEITVYLREEKKKRILFSGVVTKVQIAEQGQTKTVRLSAKSRSWLMDREKHSRSFQNTKMTYRELVREVLASYKDRDSQEESCDMICQGADQKIENLYVQYKETDWAFLKRVLSVAGLAITPDSRQEQLKLYIGVPALEEEELTYQIQEINKDMKAYYTLKANGRDVCTADFTRYRITAGQLLGMFETAFVQGKKLVVYNTRYLFQDQELIGIYGMQSPQGLKQTASYPMHLIGVALTGKVAQVSGTKIQAALTIDKEHVERAVFWFPYSTLSASPDGSGWYCMPEEGDDVRIYFPSKYEKEAVALSAVSNYTAQQAGTKDRMSDPNSRYLRTKAGQELALTPGYIRLSCGELAASVAIDTDGKVTVQAQKMIHAKAQTGVTISAEDDLNIHVKEQFIAQSLDGGQLIFSDGNISIRGTEVNFD